MYCRYKLAVYDRVRHAYIVALENCLFEWMIPTRTKKSAVRVMNIWEIN